MCSWQNKKKEKAELLIVCYKNTALCVCVMSATVPEIALSLTRSVVYYINCLYIERYLGRIQTALCETHYSNRLLDKPFEWYK